MGFIFRSLDLGVYDHCMFWVARNLAYFGFLRSAEFTVPNLATFSADLHLGVSDIAVATATLPSCLTVLIKALKHQRLTLSARGVLCMLAGVAPPVVPSSH